MPPKRGLDVGDGSDPNGKRARFVEDDDDSDGVIDSGNVSSAKRQRTSTAAASDDNPFAERLQALGLGPDATLSDVLDLDIDEFVDDYGADFMGDSEDRARLGAMTEIDREAELEERTAARITGQQNANLRRRLLEGLRKDMTLAEKGKGRRKPAAKAGRAAFADEDEEDISPRAAGGRKAKAKPGRKPVASKRKSRAPSDEEGGGDSSGSSSASSSGEGSSSGSGSDSDSSSGSDDSSEGEDASDEEYGAKKGKKAAARLRQPLRKKKPLRKGRKAAESASDSEEGAAAKDSDADDFSTGDRAAANKREAMLKARDRKMAGRQSDDEGGMGDVDVADVKRSAKRSARREDYDDGRDDEDEDDDDFADDEDEEGGLLEAVRAASRVAAGATSKAAQGGYIDDNMGMPPVPSAPPVLNRAALELLKDTAPDLRNADAADVDCIHLCRRHALAHMSAPAFKDMVVGTYVRWPKDFRPGARQPSEEDVKADRDSKYRVGRVVGVVRMERLAYDPWKNDAGRVGSRDVDAASVVRSTNLVLHVAVGSSKDLEAPGPGGTVRRMPRVIRLNQISDSRITAFEWKEYEGRLAAQFSGSGRLEEDRQPTKWDISRKAKDWKAALAGATFSTSHVEKLMAEKQRAQMRSASELSKSLNPSLLRSSRVDRLCSLEGDLAQLVSREEEARAALAHATGTGEEELDDGLGPAPNAPLRGGSAVAAALLGSLTRERLSLEKERDSVREELRAIAEEERRRRVKAASSVQTALNSGRNVSQLSSLVNERISEANSTRMTLAADIERSKDQAAEQAEIDDNPFLRRKSQPTNLFKVPAHKAGAGAGQEAQKEEPQAPAKNNEEKAPPKPVDLGNLLDDMDASEEHRAGAGSGGSSFQHSAPALLAASTGQPEDAYDLDLDLGLGMPQHAPSLISPAGGTGISLAAFRAKLRA